MSECNSRPQAAQVDCRLCSCVLQGHHHAAPGCTEGKGGCSACSCCTCQVASLPPPASASRHPTVPDPAAQPHAGHFSIHRAPLHSACPARTSQSTLSPQVSGSKSCPPDPPACPATELLCTECRQQRRPASPLTEPGRLRAAPPVPPPKAPRLQATAGPASHTGMLPFTRRP